MLGSRQVRTKEVKLVKTFEPAANIRYTGWSASQRANDSDKVWQILREYKVGEVLISEYALMGEYVCSWTDRATYFSEAIPDDANPIGGVDGTVTISGQKNSGKFTEVTINSTTWTALPSTALANRNSLTIQNQGSVAIKVSPSNVPAGYVGMVIHPSGDRSYNIGPSIVLYAKSSSGSVTVGVEEFS